MSGGVGPIPWSAIRDYIDRQQLVPPMDFVFEFCIRAMDEVYMEYQRERQERLAQK